MADEKTSALAAASALAGTEPIPVVQGGTTKRTTPAALATYVNAAGAAAAALAARSVLAGTGMSGGGDLTADRTFNVDTSVIATRAYVDALAQGLDAKVSCRAATTANITLSGAQTIDGVSVIAGDRVLVKDQSAGAENGIYVCAAGAWARSSDADVSADVTSGLYTWITEGTANGDSGWVLTTNDPIVLGTTALVFVQFNGAGQIIAGTGISKSGNTLSLTTTVQDDLAATKGEGTKALTAGGTITLSAGEAAFASIRLTGTAASNTTVEFPATNGRCWRVTNEQTDNSKSVTLKAASGSRTVYLGPGRSRDVAIVNGELRASDEKIILIEVDVSLVANTGSPVDTTICKLPDGISLRRVSARTTVAAVGGTSSFTIGTAAGGTQVQVSQTTPALGGVIGESPSHLGSDMAGTGSAVYATGPTLSLRATATTSNVTAGTVRVTVEALVL